MAQNLLAIKAEFRIARGSAKAGLTKANIFFQLWCRRRQAKQVMPTSIKKLNVKVGDMITDHVVTYFTFYDPDDNMLEVCQVHN